MLRPGGNNELSTDAITEVLVIRQVRPKLACACCDKIVQAEAASRPIARGWRGQDFWPTCWFRNTVTTCRCIGSRISMPRRCRAGSHDHGGVGRRMQPVTGAIGGGVATSHDERREAARRRYAGAGPRYLYFRSTGLCIARQSDTNPFSLYQICPL